MEFLEYDFNVNGLDVNARFGVGFVRETVMPLIDELCDMNRALGRRVVAFLAAPPACGKSVLSLLIQSLSSGRVQASGLDGFHYTNAYLSAHFMKRDGKEIPLIDIKGGPESFDTGAMIRAIRDYRAGETVKWPYYDRRIHEPVPGVTALTGDVMLVEGNWLMLRDMPWREAREFCDFTVTLTAREDILRDRSIKRKMAGGAALCDAVRHYDIVDGPNIRRFLDESLKGNINLFVTGDGEFKKLMEDGYGERF